MYFRIVNRISTNIIGSAVVEHFLPCSVKGMEIAPMLWIGCYAECDRDLNLLISRFNLALLNQRADALPDNLGLIQR